MIEATLASSVICYTYVSQVMAALMISLLSNALLRGLPSSIDFHPTVLLALRLTLILLWTVQAIFAHKARAAARNLSSEVVPTLRRFRRISMITGIVHLPLLGILPLLASYKTGRLITAISSAQTEQKTIVLEEII